jgi:hypothetical protein
MFKGTLEEKINIEYFELNRVILNAFTWNYYPSSGISWDELHRKWVLFLNIEYGYEY